MTPDQMQHEEHHAALMAVAHALTVTQQLALCREAARRWPKMDGAQAADILDLTTDHDMFLDQTEPFFERYMSRLPDSPAHTVTMHALILLGRPLTLGGVIALQVKAGILHGCPDGGTCHHQCAATCFRVLCCGPLSGVFPGDQWPESLAAEHGVLSAPYDPVADLAVVLLAFGEVSDRSNPPAAVQAASPLLSAQDRLREHLDMRTPETIEAGLRTLFGKDAQS